MITVPNVANTTDLTYELSGINEVAADILPLRAPVLDGAVLINNNDVETELEPVMIVTLGYDTMRIRRADDSLLQIADYHTNHRRLVLARPVAAIAVWRSEEGDVGKVERTSDLSVEDPESLGDFIRQVVSHLPRAAERKRAIAIQTHHDKLLQGFMEGDD